MNNHVVRRGARPLESLELRSGNAANLCIRFIIPFSILGIDRLIWSATGIPYVGATLLLIPAGLLFLRYWPCVIENWMVLLAVSPVVIYLVFATMYGIGGGVGIALLKAYFINCILITIISGHVIRSDGNEVEYILRLSKNFLFVSTISVILSPYYYPYLEDTHEEYRYSGFFIMNPNDAALSMVIFFNFLLYMPYTRKILNYLGIMMVITGILFSYSKTGIILILASWILYMTIKHKWNFVLILIPFIVVLGILFQPITVFFLENFVVVYLGENQIQRIYKMLYFVQGNFSEEYAGYKDILWPHGLSVIQENFPHGAGLGAFHHLEGGVIATKEGFWFGVHNMYLMVAGEAGFFPFLFFVGCYGGLLAFAFFSLKNRFALSIIFISLFNYGTTHNGFGHRFQIVALAICIGLLSRKANTAGPGPS